MATYYDKFTIDVPLPGETTRQYTLDLYNQAEHWHKWNDLPQDFLQIIKDAHKHESLLDYDRGGVLQYAQLGGEDGTEFYFGWDFDMEVCDDGLLLHSSEGNIAVVCLFIQHLLKRFALHEKVVFQWCRDCSNPGVAGYGGGAAIVTSGDIRIMSTGRWLCEHAPDVMIETE